MNTNTTPTPAGYDHINLNDIDTSAKPVEENVYTLEINKLDPVLRTVKKIDSPLFDTEVLVLRGSYTIVDDENYSGRKLWQDFWTAYKVPLIFLKKQMQATGVGQEDGQSLSDWGRQFELLNPPARVQVPVKKVASVLPGEDRKNPTGPPINEIDWFQAKPAA